MSVECGKKIKKKFNIRKHLERQKYKIFYLVPLLSFCSVLVITHGTDKKHWSPALISSSTLGDSFPVVVAGYLTEAEPDSSQFARM